MNFSRAASTGQAAQISANDIWTRRPPNQKNDAPVLFEP